MTPIFITGIGTDVGKTIVSAIITEALQANYWKPIQAGFSNGTDALQIKNLISNTKTIIYPEVYQLKMPASPHIAARTEKVIINLQKITDACSKYQTHNSKLIIEGAGGLLVPLNETEFVTDLILKLNAKVILVSRNYLGSINHSLLTAEVCKQKNIDVLGWVFNDQYLHYEDEIVGWSGFQKIASIPFVEKITKKFIALQAEKIKPSLLKVIG
ncbi:MAG: dethiobiotin synthase [Bacteroidetes bacterium]|nr:dethiobiotin synthase [Bacteroidota bacterium]MBS1648634.1 dethiobiotin synthase [Bacteroidota bacterium]